MLASNETLDPYRVIGFKQKIEISHQSTVRFIEASVIQKQHIEITLCNMIGNLKIIDGEGGKY